MGTMLKRLTPIIVLTLTLFLPLMASAFPADFFHSNVYYENRGYDSTKYSLTPFNRMFGEVLLRDTGDYNPYLISVFLSKGLPDPIPTKLSYLTPMILGGINYFFFQTSFGPNNPTLSDWWNKAYIFSVDGWPYLANSIQVILPDTLRKLDFVTPITITGNTISWNHVPPSGTDSYIRYRVRIQDLDGSGNPTGFYWIIDSPNLTATSYTIDPLPPGMVVGKEYALRIEAREFFNYYTSFGSGDFLNRSSFYTKFTPVPIPASFLLLGSGLLGLAGLARGLKR